MGKQYALSPQTTAGALSVQETGDGRKNGEIIRGKRNGKRRGRERVRDEGTPISQYLLHPCRDSHLSIVLHDLIQADCKQHLL